MSSLSHTINPKAVLRLSLISSTSHFWPSSHMASYSLLTTSQPSVGFSRSVSCEASSMMLSCETCLHPCLVLHRQCSSASDSSLCLLSVTANVLCDVEPATSVSSICLSLPVPSPEATADACILPPPNPPFSCASNTYWPFASLFLPASFHDTSPSSCAQTSLPETFILWLGDDLLLSGSPLCPPPSNHIVF